MQVSTRLLSRAETRAHPDTPSNLSLRVQALSSTHRPGRPHPQQGGYLGWGEGDDTSQGLQGHTDTEDVLWPLFWEAPLPTADEGAVPHNTFVLQESAWWAEASVTRSQPNRQ